MAKSYTLRRFDSILEFANASKAASLKDHASSRTDGYYVQKEDGVPWAGTMTYDEAYKYATAGGWQPGELAEFRSMFDDIVPRLRKFTHTVPTIALDNAGFQPDMGRLLAGEPDHMWEWVPDEQEATKRALCVVIGHSISSGCTAKEIFIRGQAAIALVRALALLGFELEIWSEQTVGGWGGGPGTDYYSVLTRVHAAGSIMDESAVEYAIGNPSWLRRLIFGYEEGEPEDIRKRFGFTPNGGYGTPAGIHHQALVGADIELDLGHGWFGEDSYYNWKEGAKNVAELGMKWCVEQLKKVGAIAEDAEIDWTVPA